MVVLVTGGIGSGKSTVVKALEKNGIPCFDADSVVKSFYNKDNDFCYLIPEIEDALGVNLMSDNHVFNSSRLSNIIFNDAQSLNKVERIVFPQLIKYFKLWLSAQNSPIVVLESATVLSKPDFPVIWDKCIYIDAPIEIRIERVMQRSNLKREEVLQRISMQQLPNNVYHKIDKVINNDSSLENLYESLANLWYTWFGKKINC